MANAVQMGQSIPGDYDYNLMLVILIILPIECIDRASICKLFAANYKAV